MPHTTMRTAVELISCLFAEAGQCGNQIGAKFWEVRTVSRQRGLPTRGIAQQHRDGSYSPPFERCWDALTLCSSEASVNLSASSGDIRNNLIL